MQMIQQAQEAGKNKQPSADDQRKLASANLDNVRAQEIIANAKGETAEKQLEAFSLVEEGKARAYR